MNSKKKNEAIILSVLLTVVGVKVISHYWFKTFSIEGSAVINEGSVGFAILFFALLGACVYFIISKISSDWSEEDARKSGLGSIGGIFLSNMCGAGVCLPAAVMGTVLTFPALLCVLLGILGLKHYKDKRKPSSDFFRETL